MSQPNQNRPKGRGAPAAPPNRFEAVRLEDDREHLEHDEAPAGRTATEFLADRSRSVICENDSPDIPFRYSINPYPLNVFQKRTGLGTHAMRKARRQGLRILRSGRCAFVLGTDFIEHLIRTQGDGTTGR